MTLREHPGMFPTHAMRLRFGCYRSLVRLHPEVEQGVAG